MATIQSAIKMYDGVSGPLRNMRDGMNNIINILEKVQNNMQDAFDASDLENARREIEKCGDAFKEVEANASHSASSQHEFNNSIEQGASSMDKLLGKAKGVLSVLGAIAAAKKGIEFVAGSMELADTQNNAQNQLSAVLQNMGVSYQGYQDILKTASGIQGKGIYGDETMIGGAAEFATYLSDAQAIQSMMGTLSNYAMGMSGGGEVGYSEMVDYATQLGKALNGSFDGLTKKGFQLTEAQKEIIANGTDMQKALVLDEVIGESWDNLYSTMSNTPQGELIQLKNAWGDIREEVGNRFYPVVATVAEDILNHADKIEAVIMSVGDVMVTVIAIGSSMLNGIFAIIDGVWGWIDTNNTLQVSSLQTGEVIIGGLYGVWGVVQQVNSNIEASVMNLVNSAKSAFYSFISYAVGMASKAAETLSMIPGIDIDTSALRRMESNFATSSANSYAKMQQISWGSSIKNAWKTSYSSGVDYLNKMKKYEPGIPESQWRSGSGVGSGSDLAGALADSSANTAANTAKMADSLSATESELKLLREIAERTAISQFTTASVNVTMNNNNTINSEMDIDGVVNALENAVSEGMAKTAEATHV